MKINNITFIGDISLNDKYNELYQNGEKPFKGVRDILFSSDFVVGNLECLAKGDKGENLLKKPRLKTNLETLNFLKDMNLGLALLAHNHVYDNLEDGFVKTIKFLDENNIAHIGAGLSPEEAAKPFIKNFNGTKICILNYVTYDTNPNLPNDATVYPNWFDETKVIADIKKYKEVCDKVILCLHWGGRCEGGLYPDWDQPFIARRLIDAGADLIAGNHSHTVQPFEIYKDKYIFYSLGNFCFVNFYSNNELVRLTKKNIVGKILNIELENFKVGAECHVVNVSGYLKLWKKDMRKNANYVFKLIKRYKLLWYLYYMQYKFFLPLLVFFSRPDLSLYLKIARLFKAFYKRILRNQ